MAFDVAALGAAFAAIGALPPIGVLLLAYVVGQLGGLIPLPGGVGGADGGLIAALVLYGTPLGAAAAAVLAYRAFQLGLPGAARRRWPSCACRACSSARPTSARLCEPRRPPPRPPRAMPRGARGRRRRSRVRGLSTASRGRLRPSPAAAGSRRRGEHGRRDHAADRAEQVRLPGDPLLRQQALQQPDPPDADDERRRPRARTGAG